MKNVLKKTCNIITTAVIVMVVILAILLAGVRLVGLTPYMVLSGSMEPTYHVGALIYVTDVNPADLKVKDPVTYRINGGTVVTHRIVEVIQDEENPSELYFRTQGDASKEPDGSLLPASNVIGKPIFSIPLLGYVSNFVQSPPGIYIVIGGCAVLFLMIVMMDILFRK